MSFDNVRVIRAEKRKLEIAIQNAAIADGTWSTCLKCDHWNETAETCVYYNQRPPAWVIVNGCDDFQIEIPF
jgi:hypothetical protein